MIEPTRIEGPVWSWGTEGQFWACRVSHLLGLIAVLGLLWMTIGR
jgi:hypothetical protein